MSLSLVADEVADVLVVGAGVAGLAAALELTRAGRRVVVMDAGDRAGGVLGSVRQEGHLYERGPNSLQLKPPLVAFARRHGLEELFLKADPESRKRCLLRDGELVPVPMSPLALIRTPLLSRAAKLRLLKEPWVATGDGAGESVAEFVARRLGPEVVRGLVGPFLTGVYAGDEERLGAEAVFPALVNLEREGGGLVRGGLRRLVKRSGATEQEAKGIPGVWSTASGLGTFADHLVAKLAAPPVLRTRVEALMHSGEAWRAEYEDEAGGGATFAKALVLAVPADQASALLLNIAPSAAQCVAQIDYAPIVSMAISVAPEDLRRRVEGFGFLVPREERRALLGCLFMSRLFPQRAPAGRELLQCMVGGVRRREVVELADDELRKLVLGDLDLALGLKGPPEVLAIQRWPRAVPQPTVAHLACIGELRKSLARLPHIQVAGSYVAGVSVADTIASGVSAARALM